MKSYTTLSGAVLDSGGLGGLDFFIFSKGSLGGLRVYLGLYTDYYKDYKDSNLFKGASGFRAKGLRLCWGLGFRD